MDYPKFKVCVRCMTFNQSKYIVDAMNGFVIQQTGFPFVCCIVDDASTDDEPNVIKAYLKEHFDLNDRKVAFKKETDYANIIYTQHKTNKNCFFVVLLLKENLYSKGLGEKKLEYISEWRDQCEYEALCEGDDYWIDPNKLQLQVDFLSSHPDYTFCCHRFKIFDTRTNEWHNEYAHRFYVNKNDLDIDMKLFCRTWITQPLTTLIRQSAYAQYIEFIRQFLFARDVHLFYFLLSKGRGISLNKQCGIYRRHNGGVDTGMNFQTRIRTAYEIYKELYERTLNPIILPIYIDRLMNMIAFSMVKEEKSDLINEALQFKSKFFILFSTSKKKIKQKAVKLLNKLK